MSHEFGSQASQDLFVLGILSYPKTGWYLEIGAGHPQKLSNTFLLETLGWKGISLDNGDCKREWAQGRKNLLFNENACAFDYAKTFAELGFPKTIDYLSLDIDEATNLAMRAIPFDQYDFKVITIEHDNYRLGDMLRPEQRAFLDKRYVRLCSDVQNGGLPYEDWYISKDLYTGQPKVANMNHDDIIKFYGFKDVYQDMVFESPSDNGV